MSFDPCRAIMDGEHMVRMTKRELKAMQRSVEKEFPDDPALQQVHLAREILALEAKKAGMGYLEYIRSLKIRSKDAR